LTLAVIACAALRLDVTGMAAGAALTYCWVGMTNAVRTGQVAIVEQSVIVLIVLAVIVLAIRRRGGAGGARRDPERAGVDQDGADREDTDQNRRSSARSMPRSAS
jgi:uncharacterized membrane protein